MKKFVITHAHIGILETATTLQNAMYVFFDLINNEYKHLLVDYPVSKWEIFILDEEKEDKGRYTEVFSMTTSKIKKLKEQGLF